MPRYEELSAKSAFTTFEEVAGEAESKWHERGKLMSFNAYHGARAIAEALDRGAQIVVTGISLSLTRPLASAYSPHPLGWNAGRCADSALVLGPLVHEFKWTWADHDLLSSGSLAGHIIECGCQATGGNFTDWELSLAGGVDVRVPRTRPRVCVCVWCRRVPRGLTDCVVATQKSREWSQAAAGITWAFRSLNAGPTGHSSLRSPKVRAPLDDGAHASKLQRARRLTTESDSPYPGTGGVVTTATVGEQMLYEIHNPAAYILPDVVCNWEQVRMTQLGPNRVLVHGNATPASCPPPPR